MAAVDLEVTFPHSGRRDVVRLPNVAPGITAVRLPL